MGAGLRGRHNRQGRGIRVLTVVDAFTRKCLGLEVDSSLSSRRVTRVLEQIIEQRERGPEAIKCDNEPELTSRHIMGWCEEVKINLVHIHQVNRCRMVT